MTDDSRLKLERNRVDKQKVSEEKGKKICSQEKRN